MPYLEPDPVEKAAPVAAGWGVAELLETVLVISLMNFANRFAMGLRADDGLLNRRCAR
jgi:hypothetical protein